MSKPTLLTAGNIVIKKWMTPVEKRKAEHESSIDFILDFISDRTPSRRGGESKIKPKGFGEKVLLLKSGTGSGKSTVLPPGLYDRFFDNLHKNIGITEPRILTTVDIPLGILSYNPQLKLGQNIGYQTGSIIKKPVKGIVFMTVGIILEQLKTLTDEELIKKYMFILIDEVHEREENLDLTLLYLKGFLERNYDNPDCPMIILMSATFDETTLMKYFKVPKENYIEVTGRTFPKEINYEKYPVTNWINRISELVVQIHTHSSEEPKDKDILIFVSSGKQIADATDELNKLNLNTDFIKHGYILPIRLDSESYKKGGREYQNLFAPINQLSVEVKGKLNRIVRRVIIATNVAETGVTIDSLRYCIDTGFVISVEFNPVYAVTTVLRKNVTQGMSEQRAGRVGRKAPGIVYLLYTKEMFDMFLKDQYPQLITNEITNNLLGDMIRETRAELSNPISLDFSEEKDIVIYSKPFNALSLDFLTYPSSASIQYSLEKLYTLGFITQIGSTMAPYKKKKNGEIIPTAMGIMANQIRKTKLENIRMIFAGYQHGCNILDLITITTLAQGRWTDIASKRRGEFQPMNPLNLKNKEQVALYNKIVFADEFIEYLFIWLMFMNVVEEQSKKKNPDLDKIKKWVEDHNLKYDGLLDVASRRDELIESFVNLGYNPFWNGLGLKRGSYNLINILRHNLEDGIEEIKKIKRCIYEGYRMNMATYNSIINKYVMDYKKVEIDIVDSQLISPLPLVDDIKQARPQNIIIGELTLNPMGAVYGFFANTISVVDGFVEFDHGLPENYP